MKYKTGILLMLVSTIFVGCASVPMANRTDSDKAKEFSAPKEGNAGIYVYRINSPVGGALKKDVFIDGNCLGETAPGVFFYKEVQGGKETSIGTESEFSANTLNITTESGRLYFINQYIKMGMFVGGANVELVNEEKGKEEVRKIDMGISGKCSYN